MNMNPNLQPATEFSALPPAPVTLTIADQTLELTPIRVGELPGFVRAVRPFAERLAQTVDWFELFAEHGEALLEALAIASRRPQDWIATLALDEAIELADTLLEVNADFFIHRVAPVVRRVGARLATRSTANEKQTLGRAPSTGSYAPATATPTF
jgi:hypothetical protein